VRFSVSVSVRQLGELLVGAAGYFGQGKQLGTNVAVSAAVVASTSASVAGHRAPPSRQRAFAVRTACTSSNQQDSR
jgi:hypothetical protein